jgi:hypothetical protein
MYVYVSLVFCNTALLNNLILHPGIHIYIQEVLTLQNPNLLNQASQAAVEKGH